MLTVINDNTDIATTINNAIATAVDAIDIFFPKGTYNISAPILIPNSKKVSIRGEIGSLLVLTSLTPGDCIFKVFNDRDSWSGSLYAYGLRLRARSAPGQSCFGTDQSDKVNYEALHLENLYLSSTDYNIKFNNQEYTISPKFINLRGNNGLYWGGATHSASNLLIEGCRFQNGTRGPQIYVSGARKWTITNNITEGSVRWDADVDVDAPDVLKTRGVLLNNPGPASGNLHAQWCEYWIDIPDYFDITFRYTFNNGGANRPSDYWLTQTSLHKFQVINTSNTDAFSIYANCSTWSMPNFSDPTTFRTTGKVHVYVSGGEVNRRYKFDNPNVTINSGTIITPNFGTDYYKDSVSLLYAYKGGTGVYTRGATAGNWVLARPYVQHNPKYGHSLVWKSITKLSGIAFKQSMPLSLSNGQPSQEVWVACPHFTGTPVMGNGNGIGVVGSIGNRFYYEGGHTPKRFVGGAEDKPIISFLPVSSVDTTTGKWAQIFTSASWRGGFGESPAIAQNYDCYEWPNEVGPPLGTSIVGDICRSSTTENYWVCTQSGTSRPISVIGDIVKSTKVVTNISDITELLIGDFILIDGSTLVYRVMDIVDGTLVLDKNVNITATGVAITNATPFWVSK